MNVGVQSICRGPWGGVGLIAAPHEMLRRETTHGPPVEEVVDPHAVARQPERVDPMAQGAAEPAAERHRETMLGTVHHLGWHQSADRLAEHALADPIPDLESGREAERELDERMVEQGHARLE